MLKPASGKKSSDTVTDYEIDDTVQSTVKKTVSPKKADSKTK